MKIIRRILLWLAVSGFVLHGFSSAVLAENNPAGSTIVVPVEKYNFTRQEVEQSFVSLSTELAGMHGHFRREAGQFVTLDLPKVHLRKFSKKSIILAKELAALTNDILAAVAAGLGVDDIAQAPVDIQQYPLLAAYFDEAAKRAEKRERGEHDPETDQLAGINSWLSESHCGTFWNPRPSRAIDPRVHNSGDPIATLRSWNYHQTPDFAGGGWTRPQTYDWWICGFHTFRDHAWLTGPMSFKEQNYDGWTPRGEPNPEVWRSGPWPYNYWPTYVLWWHSRY